MIYLFAALFTVACFPIWCFMHEMSHVLMAKYRVGVESWSIKVWPHKHPTLGFVFGSANYKLKRYPTWSEQAKIMYAPRYMNLVAVAVLPWSWLIPWPFLLFWLIFWGAGLVDFIVGSVARSPMSDTQRLAQATGMNIWVFRIVFGAAIIFSIIFTTIILVA